MKRKPPSKSYCELLDYINARPEILSDLYDLNLLPELVDDKKRFGSRQSMIAFVFGYKCAMRLNKMFGVP